MTRLEANKKILDILNEIAVRHPDWRFNQILQNMNTVVNGQDLWYEESVDTLKRIMYARGWDYDTDEGLCRV